MSGYAVANAALAAAIWGDTSAKPKAAWGLIAFAPHDRAVWVYCPPAHGLPELVSLCQWHESAGFCVDELRTPTLYQELEPPALPGTLTDDGASIEAASQDERDRLLDLADQDDSDLGNHAWLWLVSLPDTMLPCARKRKREADAALAALVEEGT